jgi:hypothetical protein
MIVRRRIEVQHDSPIHTTSTTSTFLLSIYLLCTLVTKSQAASTPLILTTKEKEEIMILDMKASSNHGLSSENEWQPTLAHNNNAGQHSGGQQNGESGHLIKLPFRVDVAHGSQEMNIMEWQAGANKTHHFVQRGDLIKVGNGGHIVQTSRSKFHSVYNIHLIHPYTHVSDTSVDCYLVVQGKGMLFEPADSDTSEATSSTVATSQKHANAVVTLHAIDDTYDKEKSYLLIGTTLHGLLRPQLLFHDEHLQFLSRAMVLSVMHGPLSFQAAGHLKFMTRKDIVLNAGSGSKETDTPRGSIALIANSMKGIQMYTENEISEKHTGAIHIKTGSTASPLSSPGTIDIVVGSAGVGSQGSGVTVRAGNVTGDNGVGGALRMHAGDAPGNFHTMENNNAVGGEALLSSGSGLTQSGDLHVLTGHSQYKSGDVCIETGKAGRGQSGNIKITTADAYVSGNVTISVGHSKLDQSGAIYLDGAVMMCNSSDEGGHEKTFYNLEDRIQQLESVVEKQEQMILGLLGVLEKMNVGNEVVLLEKLALTAVKSKDKVADKMAPK